MQGWKVVPVLLVGLMLVGGSRAARADLINVYSDRAAFNAATANRTDLDFEGTAPPNSFTFYPSPPGLTLSGVNFQAASGNALYAIDPNFSPPGFAMDSGQYLASQQGGSTRYIITLPANITAIGLDIGNFNTYPDDQFTFNFSDGSAATATAGTQPNYNFAGFAFTTPISSFTISNPADNFNAFVDNVSVGQAVAPVPEPSTWAMMILGLGGIAVSGWRKKRKDAAV